MTKKRPNQLRQSKGNNQEGGRNDQSSSSRKRKKLSSQSNSLQEEIDELPPSPTSQFEVPNSGGKTRKARQGVTYTYSSDEEEPSNHGSNQSNEKRGRGGRGRGRGSKQREKPIDLDQGEVFTAIAMENYDKKNSESLHYKTSKELDAEQTDEGWTSEIYSNSNSSLTYNSFDEYSNNSHYDDSEEQIVNERQKKWNTDSHSNNYPYSSDDRADLSIYSYSESGRQTVKRVGENANSAAFSFNNFKTSATQLQQKQQNKMRLDDLVNDATQPSTVFAQQPLSIDFSQQLGGEDKRTAQPPTMSGVIGSSAALFQQLPASPVPAAMQSEAPTSSTQTSQNVTPHKLPLTATVTVPLDYLPTVPINHTTQSNTVVQSQRLNSGTSKPRLIDLVSDSPTPQASFNLVDNSNTSIHAKNSMVISRPQSVASPVSFDQSHMQINSLDWEGTIIMLRSCSNLTYLNFYNAQVVMPHPVLSIDSLPVNLMFFSVKRSNIQVKRWDEIVKLKSLTKLMLNSYMDDSEKASLFSKLGLLPKLTAVDMQELKFSGTINAELCDYIALWKRNAAHATGKLILYFNANIFEGVRPTSTQHFLEILSGAVKNIYILGSSAVHQNYTAGIRVIFPEVDGSEINHSILPVIKSISIMQTLVLQEQSSSTIFSVLDAREKQQVQMVTIQKCTLKQYDMMPIFGRLGDLKISTLSLYDVNIMSHRDAISALKVMTSLQVLSLRNNSIPGDKEFVECFADAMKALVNLKQFDISDNPLVKTYNIAQPAIKALRSVLPKGCVLITEPC